MVVESLAIDCVYFQPPDQAVAVKLDVLDALALQVFARIGRVRLQAEVERHSAIVVAKVFREPENVGVASEKALHHVAYGNGADELTDGG